MSQDLIWKINNIFQIIKEPIDVIYKLTAIEKCKVELGIERTKSLGELYSKIIKEKKEKGVVYTPIEIADYMIKNTIAAKDIINNAFLKIIDPACGCGNIIIPCFLHLQKLYNENLQEINIANGLKLKEADINRHIVKNNIFGFDIDEAALKILCIDLFYIAKCIEFKNFKNFDFLFYEEDEKYDVFIGNPPYIGHKAVDKDYAFRAKTKYKELYSDKGDIAYCFYGAALSSLAIEGKITFISSRYFLESPSGAPLRKVFKEHCSIKRIIDFYGIRPFKNAGIDPVILFLEQDLNNVLIEVVKPSAGSENNFIKSFFNNKSRDFSIFNINKTSLDDSGWSLLDEKERSIIDKIKKKCNISLSDICESYQGVVTGCDKAFIVDEAVINTENLETDIIKPWIKSSFIKKDKVLRADKFIIYSNLIESESSHRNCLKHIEVYQDKLMERRECKKNIRKWYELQWGRVMDIFETEKIVFPYKSSNNRFAVDIGSYFSADVYCLILKEEAPYTYEYLSSILNSKIYEFYFKSFAKKLGENLYEYYPNTIMKLKIPVMIPLEGNVDCYLSNYFELEVEEINIINNYLKTAL